MKCRFLGFIDVRALAVLSRDDFHNYPPFVFVVWVYWARLGKQ